MEKEQDFKIDIKDSEGRWQPITIQDFLLLSQCLKDNMADWKGNKNSKYKHGFKNNPNYKSEYSTWKEIKSRCYNKNRNNYCNYGGRGIKVCERWLDKEKGFLNFLDDMGKKPFSTYSIERVDCDVDYIASNCVWASRTTQNRNRRNNVVMEYKNTKLCLAAWAEKLEMSYMKSYKILKRNKDHNFEYVIESVIKPSCLLN